MNRTSSSAPAASRRRPPISTGFRPVTTPKLMGNFHPFDFVSIRNQPQTRVIFLAGNQGGIGSEGDYFYGYDSDYGIGGYGPTWSAWPAMLPSRRAMGPVDAPARARTSNSRGRTEYVKTRRQLIQAAATHRHRRASQPAWPCRENRILRMIARIFFDSYNTLALRQALRYAGDDGFVASLPQLLHARVKRRLRQHRLEHLVPGQFRGKRGHDATGKPLSSSPCTAAASSASPPASSARCAPT